jgi:PAS domain S-box-containing protein
MPNSFTGMTSADVESVLMEAPIACHELDRDGNVVWINPAGCRLLGVSAEQILKQPIWTFVAAEEREASRQAVERKLSGATALSVFERTFSRPGGPDLVLEIHEHYRLSAEGEILGMRSFLLDITARKQAEEALRRGQEELESRIRERTQELELAIDFLRREMEERRQAEKEHRKLEAQVQYSQRLESIGVLAGGVAHEFNNLLTSIMGYTSMACMEVPKESRVRDHLGQVLSAAKSAADLTQQILAYSGRGQFVLEALDLSQIANGTARLLESIVSPNAKLAMDLSPELPRIDADASQIRQVIINLVNNASDALGNHEGEIALHTGLVWADGGELPTLQSGHMVPAGFYVYLEVKDTGSGMDAETLAKMFDPFFTTKFTGRGLGLPAVIGIVRAHRGSIRVASKVGQGTEVRVYFPVREEGEAQAAAPSAADTQAWPRAGTVLVVDDEQPIRNLASTILEGAGLTVFCAADGHEALDVFRQHAAEIHAVLLDLTMPGMDGAQVFQEMHQIRPEVRVVLCSGYNEHEVTSRLGDQRPAGFLRKPYQPRELLKLIGVVW